VVWTQKRGDVESFWWVKRDRQWLECTRRKEGALDVVRGYAEAAGAATVRIHTKDGRIAEERTYPRSADPKRSKG
jgi:hypothetical protein